MAAAASSSQWPRRSTTFPISGKNVQASLTVLCPACKQWSIRSSVHLWARRNITFHCGNCKHWLVTVSRAAVNPENIPVPLSSDSCASEQSSQADDRSFVSHGAHRASEDSTDGYSNTPQEPILRCDSPQLSPPALRNECHHIPTERLSTLSKLYIHVIRFFHACCERVFDTLHNRNILRLAGWRLTLHVTREVEHLATRPSTVSSVLQNANISYDSTRPIFQDNTEESVNSWRAASLQSAAAASAIAPSAPSVALSTGVAPEQTPNRRKKTVGFRELTQQPDLEMDRSRMNGLGTIDEIGVSSQRLKSFPSAVSVYSDANGAHMPERRQTSTVSYVREAALSMNGTVAPSSRYSVTSSGSVDSGFIMDGDQHNPLAAVGVLGRSHHMMGRPSRSLSIRQQDPDE